jgi:hypothetical protein
MECGDMSPLSEGATRRADPSSDRPASHKKAPFCQRTPKKFVILIDLVPVTSSAISGKAFSKR